jgi:hypothetical protein
MSVEATSSDARKAAIRERSQERIQEQQDRLAEATNEAETKKQAMRARAAVDAVRVDISSTRK